MPYLRRRFNPSGIARKIIGNHSNGDVDKRAALTRKRQYSSCGETASDADSEGLSEISPEFAIPPGAGRVTSPGRKRAGCRRMIWCATSPSPQFEYLDVARLGIARYALNETARDA